MNEKDIIKEALKSRNITQKMLAEQAGYKRQSSYTSLMSGKSMRVDNFVKLLDALGYDLIVKDRNGSNRENVWKVEPGQDE